MWELLKRYDSAKVIGEDGLTLPYPTVLQVLCRDADGVPYQNPLPDAKVRIICTAVGSWTYNPRIGWHTVDGSQFRTLHLKLLWLGDQAQEIKLQLETVLQS